MEELSYSLSAVQSNFHPHKADKCFGGSRAQMFIGGFLLKIITKEDNPDAAFPSKFVWKSLAPSRIRPFV